MRRLFSAFVVPAAILLFCHVSPVAAADLSSGGLSGLAAVRVEVVGLSGLDAVDLEVSVLERLASRGILGDPGAMALLTVDAHAEGDFACAGVSLLQNVALERDPLLTVQVPTWSMGETARLGTRDNPQTVSLDLVHRVIDRFLEAWSEVNL